MDLRRLRHFNVLAETRNFSRAAERLHIAQPALSVSIQKLESELGSKLFERTPTGVLLTAAGEAALIEARRTLFHGDQLLRSVRDLASGTRGSLRIGFVGTATYRLIPSIIPAFRSQYPEVELVLREATSAAIVSMLNEERIDLGIVRTPLLQTHALALTPLQRDQLVLALPASHLLACAPHIALPELAKERFIMYSADAAGLHASVMTACESAGFTPLIAQEATQVPTLLALVESGLGIGLVPEVMEGFGKPRIVYKKLQPPAASEMTLALAHFEGGGSPAGQRFIELATAICHNAVRGVPSPHPPSGG